jgi:hypothetical protein
MISEFNIQFLKRSLLGLVALFFFLPLIAQKPITQLNGFGHVEYTLQQPKGDKTSSFFSIGEHDFFITSKLNKKISFLGEYVIRFNGSSATNFLPSIERTLVKFNYYKNHNIIAGKIHTPINYWNDVYHHGRLFFPTIDRPLSFSYLIPLHTLGMQFQGQNLGRLNFGYDVVVGNGISSTDVFNTNSHSSLTAAIHIKPTDGMRIGASYYTDYLPNNMSGVHSGHAGSKPHYSGPLYKGPVRFRLSAFSFAYFNDRYEILNEFVYNRTITDTLGKANNFSNFLYAGLRIGEKHVPYILIDYLNVDKNDLHAYPIITQKFALGYKHEFTPFINLKSQIEYSSSRLPHEAHSHDMGGALSLRVQLAYGF